MVLFWSSCKEQLKQDLSDNDFKLWVVPLIHTGNQNTLTLHCQNTRSLSWIRNNILTKIESILQSLSKHHLPIKVQLKCLPPSESLTKNNFFIATKPNQDFTFETFVQAPSNEEAIFQAKNLANSESETNLLFIQGTEGLGKTHLLHSITNQYLTNNPTHKVMCLHTESFVQNLVNSLQYKTLSEFQDHYRSADLLLIDDIQFIAGKQLSQEKLTFTFQALLENNKRIVVTSPCSPNKLTELSIALSSLFYQGTIVKLTRPDIEMLMTITLKKFRQVNIEPDPQIVLYFAQHFSSNIRELEGVIRRVISLAQYTNQLITLNLVKETIAEFIH